MSVSELSLAPAIGRVPAAATQIAEDLALASTHLADALRSVEHANKLLVRAAEANARDRHRIVMDIQKVKNNLSILESTAIAAEHTAGTWKNSSDKDLASHMGRITREGTREGRQTVARAITLHDLPVVAEGFKSGALTPSHVDVVAKALVNVPESVAQEFASLGIQEKLVRGAKLLPPWQFAKTVTSMIAALSPQTIEDKHQAQRERRFFHVTDTPDGTVLKGFLDRVSGKKVKLALEVLMHRPKDDDGRSGEQRTADALVEMSENVLNDGQFKTGALLRPHVSVVIGESTWKSLRSPRPQFTPSGRGRGRGSREGRDETSGSSPREGQPRSGTNEHPASAPPAGSALDVAARLLECDPVVDDSGMVMPPSEVGRVLCDCVLTRLVVDAGSELTDLGRANRLYANAQRRAVYVRDQGCAWAGCEVPVRWCEVHHIEWWSRGGATSIENGVALCGFHHGQVHSRNLTITRTYGSGLDIKNPGDLALGGFNAKERDSMSQGRSLPSRDPEPSSWVASSQSISSRKPGNTAKVSLARVGYVITDHTRREVSRT